MPEIWYSEDTCKGNPHVLIATSGYSFNTNYVHSLSAATARLAQQGVQVDLIHMDGHCHVDDARNAMVRYFRKGKADYLVMIDNDVGFSPGALVGLCLLPPTYDVVGGVYPCKSDETEYPVRVPSGVELQADQNGLVEVDGIPAGFMRISRRSVEKLVEKHNERSFVGKNEDPEDIPNVVLFERSFGPDKIRYSGDYEFCNKWKALGGSIYVDPEMRFTHTGTKTWSGCVGDYWKKEYGVTESLFRRSIQKIRHGGIDSKVLSDLVLSWSNPYCADPEVLLTLAMVVKGLPPNSQVLEFGSGLSTLVMAASSSDVDIISLESYKSDAVENQQLLEKLNLENAEIRHVKLNGTGFYSPDYGDPVIPDVVFIDGPNRRCGNRTSVFDTYSSELLYAQNVIIDDADDETLKRAFRDWCNKNDLEFTLVGKRMAISTR